VVRITPPGRSNVEVQPRNGQAVFAETDSLGVYGIEIVRPGASAIERAVAVNLQNAAESRVAPLRQLAIVQESGQAVAVTTERNGRSEFWRWLAAIGLVVLVVEWLVYQRPALALLRQRWSRMRPQHGG
jgi:hypothetical protein